MERGIYQISKYRKDGNTNVWEVNQNTNGLIPLNLNGDVFWQYPSDSIQYHFAS